MKKQEKSSIARTMISVSGIVFIAKVFGFIKQMVTANAFGATIDTDIITISEGLVINIDFLLVQTLMTAFIPTYINTKSKKKEDAKRFVSNTVLVFFIITVIISILIALASPLLSRILAPTYKDELSKRLALYLCIFSPVIVLLVEMAVFNSLLKANESFIPGELISWFQSIILIVLIWTVGDLIGPDTLVWGFYAYALLSLLFLMIWSRKHWSIYLSNPFSDTNIRQMLSMMGPLLLGYAMIFINQQVDKIIVSGLGEGTVTAMNYAAVLSNFVNAFATTVCGVLFTYITKNIVNRDTKKAASLILTSTLQMITIILPISILTVMNASDIVRIVFGRGRFDDAAIKSCSAALIGYGFAFVPYVLRELYSRFQYGYSDSKTPMINSTIAIFVNIILSIVLSFWLGVFGVTIATSISVLICAVLNMVTSRKKNKELCFVGLVKYVPQWLIGSLLCIVVSVIGKRLMQYNGAFLRFFAIVSVSFLGYCVININIIKPFIMRFLRKKG